MNSRLPLILSYILHPLLIPLYVILLLLYLPGIRPYEYPVHVGLLIIGTVAVITILFPLLLLFFMRRLGLIRSWYLEDREERAFPLILMTVFYYLAFYLLKPVYLPGQYQLFLLVAAFLAVAALVITWYFRISLHLIALGTVCGLWLGIIMSSGSSALLPLLVFIILSGIAGTARLSLRAHRPVEIYTGWLLGFITMSAATLLF